MKNFVIFDVNRPILEADALTTANTPIEAVKKYLKGNNIAGTPKRSGSNYVTISCREFVLRDGVKYYTHKPTQWYEITNK